MSAFGDPWVIYTLRCHGALNDEHKKAISTALRGRKLSESHRRNIIKSLTGRHVSEEKRRKLSISNRNRPRSLEARKQMSLSARKRHIREFLQRVEPALAQQLLASVRA